MDFIQHLVTVRTSVVATTEDRVKASFINDCIKSAVLKLQTLRVHLLIRHLRNLLFVMLLHLLDNSEGDIDVRDLLVTILKHLLAHLGVAATDV